MTNGLEKGILIPDARPFFTRIPHLELLSSLLSLRPQEPKSFFLRPGVPLISWSGWPPPPPPPHLSQGLHPPLSRILFSFPIPNLYPTFGESRFPGSSQIPYPVKESRIPKILPDPEEKSRSRFSETFVNVWQRFQRESSRILLV